MKTNNRLHVPTFIVRFIVPPAMAYTGCRKMSVGSYGYLISHASKEVVLDKVVQSLNRQGYRPFMVTETSPGHSKETLLWVCLDTDVQAYTVSLFSHLKRTGMFALTGAV